MIVLVLGLGGQATSDHYPCFNLFQFWSFIWVTPGAPHPPLSPLITASKSSTKKAASDTTGPQRRDDARSRRSTRRIHQRPSELRETPRQQGSATPGTAPPTNVQAHTRPRCVGPNIWSFEPDLRSRALRGFRPLVTSSHRREDAGDPEPSRVTEGSPTSAARTLASGRPRHRSSCRHRRR